MPNAHGKFVWYELMTTEPAAAQAFYSNAIGWSARDAGMPGMSYTLLTAGKINVAGLMALPDSVRAMGMPPCWTGYIGVDDVDATAAKVKQAGGAIHREPTDIPGVGRFAIAADPHGAFFALFKESAGMRGEPPPAGAPGTFGWHELYAGDREADFAFYSGLFGWEKADALDMGPMGIYQITARGGVAFGGMMTKPEAMPGPCWSYYVNVAEVDGPIGRVTSGGGQVLNGPHQVPGGSWIVQCRDPQGAFFNFVGPRG